jgi:nucleotide-binding universal stress UspA family protein
MLAIHTILHPTDFSPNSDYALHLATALARDHGARLILLHVRPIPTVVYGYGEAVLPPETEDLQAELERVHVGDPNVQVSRHFEEGDPVTQILNVAEESHVDLIVMGTHGRRGLSRLVMGSVAEQVVRRAPCPVLTVRTPFHEEQTAVAAERGKAEDLAL